MSNLDEEEQKLKELEDINRFDFTKFELDYIKKNANFNELQEKVFDRLTDKKGRQSIVKISNEENISTATTSRIIKQIKKKILRLL